MLIVSRRTGTGNLLVRAQSRTGPMSLMGSDLNSAGSTPNRRTTRSTRSPRSFSRGRVEVRILGRQACIAGLDGDVTPKIKAIIAYMAFHREVVRQRLRRRILGRVPIADRPATTRW